MGKEGGQSRGETRVTVCEQRQRPRAPSALRPRTGAWSGLREPHPRRSAPGTGVCRPEPAGPRAAVLRGEMRFGEGASQLQTPPTSEAGNIFSAASVNSVGGDWMDDGWVGGWRGDGQADGRMDGWTDGGAGGDELLCR